MLTGDEAAPVAESSGQGASRAGRARSPNAGVAEPPSNRQRTAGPDAIAAPAKPTAADVAKNALPSNVDMTTVTEAEESEYSKTRGRLNDLYKIEGEESETLKWNVNNLSRPPIVILAEDQPGTRLWELRPVNDNFVLAIMCRMLHNRHGNTLASVVIIRPDGPRGCASKADFDMAKFRTGGYDAYFIGGSHKISAKK